MREGFLRRPQLPVQEEQVVEQVHLGAHQKEQLLFQLDETAHARCIELCHVELKKSVRSRQLRAVSFHHWRLATC